MTPAARVAAAIGVLDRVLAGEAAEKALTNWARASRYAGSGDRRAVRDLVFDALRRRRSYAALGGAETGRDLMIGRLIAAGEAPEAVFAGGQYAPDQLRPEESALFAAGGSTEALPEAVRLDVPDWLVTDLRSSLGADFAAVLQALRDRAPVFLRVNLTKSDRYTAIRALASEGIAARAHPMAPTAIEVQTAAHRVHRSDAYLSGLVELQDAASQAVVEALQPVAGATVLDWCAGGGGKSLALAALGAEVTAHDADPGRMADLPVRAARAGAAIATLVDRGSLRAASWDLVLADAPCSGSGAWRRQPEAKWRLTARDLADLVGTQAAILDEAADLVRPGGRLAYGTCSILDAENADQITAFEVRNDGWTVVLTRRFLPTEGGDGFYLAVLRREAS